MSQGSGRPLPGEGELGGAGELGSAGELGGGGALGSVGALGSAEALGGAEALGSAAETGDKESARVEFRANVLKFIGFCAVGLVVILVLPGGTIDPWNIIAPRFLLMLVFMVLAIQFISYGMIESNKKDGLLLMGGLIGIVNSNVLNGAMASISKQNPSIADHAAAAVVCGNLAMLVRNAVIVSVLGAAAAQYVLPPLLAMVIVGGIAVYFRIRRINKRIEQVDLRIENPFAIGTALRFCLVLVLITVAGFAIHEFFGETGLYVTAFISVYAAGGPIVISSVMLAQQGHISYLTAATVIMIASISSCSNDAVIQYFCGATDLAVSFLRLTVPILVTGCLVLGIVWFLA